MLSQYLGLESPLIIFAIITSLGSGGLLSLTYFENCYNTFENYVVTFLIFVLGFSITFMSLIGLAKFMIWFVKII